MLFVIDRVSNFNLQISGPTKKIAADETGKHVSILFGELLYQLTDLICYYYAATKLV